MTSERPNLQASTMAPLLEAAQVTLLFGGVKALADVSFSIREGELFSIGWSRSKLALDKAVKLKEPWTIHDLRRTVRTGLGMLGVLPHVAEAALNHLPPKLIRTYDRNTYTAEKRDALERWANHLAVAVAQASGANVHKLKKKKPIPA
jgi:hypothetical protein